MSLYSPDTLSKKWGTDRIRQHMIKRPYFKLSPFGWGPTYSIVPTLYLSDRIQKIQERSDQVHLPIMHWYDKIYNPLNIFINKLHMIHHLASIQGTILNNSGNIFRDWFPHHTLCQNLILDLSSISYISILPLRRAPLPPWNTTLYLCYHT